MRAFVERTILIRRFKQNSQFVLVLCFDCYFIPGCVDVGAEVTIFVVILSSVATPMNRDTATFIRAQK